jgi:hypothetical protein
MTKVYCNECKRNFLVHHTDCELISIRPDLESNYGGEFEDRIYSCPRCDKVFIHTEYSN